MYHTDSQYEAAILSGHLALAQEFLASAAQDAGMVVALPANFPTPHRFSCLHHDSHTATGPHAFNTKSGAFFSTEKAHPEGYREFAREFDGVTLPTTAVFLRAERPRYFNGDDEEQFEEFTSTRRSANDVIAAGFDSEVMLFGNGHYEVAVYSSAQIKLATPRVHGDDGELMPLSRRFDDGDDIRGQVSEKRLSGKSSLAQRQPFYETCAKLDTPTFAR